MRCLGFVDFLFQVALLKGLSAAWLGDTCSYWWQHWNQVNIVAHTVAGVAKEEKKIGQLLPDAFFHIVLWAAVIWLYAAHGTTLWIETWGEGESWLPCWQVRGVLLPAAHHLNRSLWLFLLVSLLLAIIWPDSLREDGSVECFDEQCQKMGSSLRGHFLWLHYKSQLVFCYLNAHFRLNECEIAKVGNVWFA